MQKNNAKLIALIGAMKRIVAIPYYSPLLLTIGPLLFSMSAYGADLKATEQIKYFEVVTGYSAPVVPRGEITYQEAVARIAYYKVTYNKQLQIITVQKYLHGKHEFKYEYEYEYEYDDQGNVSSWVTINAEGELIQVLPVKQ